MYRLYLPLDKQVLALALSVAILPAVLIMCDMFRFFCLWGYAEWVTADLFSFSLYEKIKSFNI